MPSKRERRNRNKAGREQREKKIVHVDVPIVHKVKSHLDEDPVETKEDAEWYMSRLKCKSVEEFLDNIKKHLYDNILDIGDARSYGTCPWDYSDDLSYKYRLYCLCVSNPVSKDALEWQVNPKC